ncbi:alpha/beta hydrolase [uncultured Rhodospira sp.]|uniref:alpha/beta fold hydrolase n=1 Tax=uncultured Rhodospira sp. TaxID=1936189 RepID=UPI0026016011|nr:alpha/beta hydrolase [uncultured Rhodospira sp.]
MSEAFETEDLTVSVDGVRLPARWVRPSADTDSETPVLVFLHEGLGSIAQWKDFPEALCRATGLPGFVYERQGHGNADPLNHWPRPIGYLETEAEHVLPRVLDAAGIERFVHVGHSDGGSIALLHAALRPQGLLGVVTEGAHVVVEDVTLDSIRAARDAFRHGDLRTKLQRWHGRNTDGVFWGWNTTWLHPAFAARDISDRLRAIRCPLLAIQGEDDEYGTPRQVEAICRESGGLTTPMILPECGHVPHHQVRDAVLAVAASAIETWTTP